MVCAPSRICPERRRTNGPGLPALRPLGSGKTAANRAAARTATDRAAAVCPVGVILKKRVGFAVPIGQRTYDRQPISASMGADDKAGAGIGEAG